MLKRILQAVIVATGSMVAVEVTTYLLGTLKLGRLPSVVAGGFSSVIIVIGFEVVVRYFCRHVPFIRKQIDPRSRFEGTWIITIPENKERPYAYAWIEYQPESDSYRYGGASFSTEGKMESNWVCSAVTIDLDKDEIRFCAHAEIYKDKEDLINFGWIRFERKMFSRKRRYARGKGSFVDCGREVVKYNFYLDRLEPEFVSEAISKREVVTHEDMSWLIQFVHSYRQLDSEAKGYNQPSLETDRKQEPDSNIS